MIDRGLLQAATWSYDEPRPLSGGDLRSLAIDSRLWKSPGVTNDEEQVRVTATEAGNREYFAESHA
jgi:hypothetical protein